MVTALARASSFSKLRSITRKREAEPSPAERRRITIACLYIFWTLALTLPAGTDARGVRGCVRETTFSENPFAWNTPPPPANRWAA